MKVAVILAVLVAAASGRVVQREPDAKEVCYESYGCFGTAAPWTSLIRPLSATPKPPYEVGTRYVLYTRGTQETEQVGFELLPDKDAILAFSDFKASRKTYFLIHGFTDSYRVDWVAHTKDLLLTNEDVNIIAVDWAPGAKTPYLQATANARLVGAMIARLITYLEQKAELKTDDIHIISHSLGSHVAGYAGDRLLGRLARITAIDPMEQYFGGTDPLVRLDTTDAKFVEVIHSNADAASNLGLGMSAAIGHVDIYPNGGKKQPGCKDTLGNLIGSIIDLITFNFEGAISQWACSHARAAHFYAESISEVNECGFVAFPCKSFAEYEKGTCYHDCTQTGTCNTMGYNAKHVSGASGVYYLRTTDGANNHTYCKQVVQIQVPVSLIQKPTTGYLTITARGDDGATSDKFTLADNVKMSAGQVLNLWAEIPHHILKRPDFKPSLTVRYTRGGLLPGNQEPTLALDSISFVVIKPDLSSEMITYRGVTLNYGADTVINE